VENRPVYINEVPVSWDTLFEIEKNGPIPQISSLETGDSHVVQPQTK
jgi:hypothetical protein